jgi:hypothetical protein
MDAFLNFEKVYDVQTGVVNVNTPEMASWLERINEVPSGPGVSFEPDGVITMFTGFFGPFSAVDHSFTRPAMNFMYHFINDLHAPWIFFLQDNPRILFSHPVFQVAQTGEIRFHSQVTPAIMRNSPNQELAWEFIRFCMEFSETLYVDPRIRPYNEQGFFPVNRAMFDSHLRTVLDESHRIMVRFEYISVTGDEVMDEADRDARIEYSIYRFTELMEMLNLETRINMAVWNSLIYPDIYLFVTGRQNIGRTLANIQSRLELYVAE